jgi:hypothetical protein
VEGASIGVGGGGQALKNTGGSCCWYCTQTRWVKGMLWCERLLATHWGGVMPHSMAARGEGGGGGGQDQAAGLVLGLVLGVYP